ncbi:putative thiol methyltransferase 2 [Psilocybe cubensis]|uniref:Thiol methyltransferase 2 n=2 Tax=Psilocybe cubensis TaxID=181762 RepID=A0ACB8GPM7_PSICU|nr:putative thiol methyltransferase 2 [Psilocybe cubensis]KAH9477419.1 putative thiol methyltransferase 2 [Psilocybe cubensis]
MSQPGPDQPLQPKHIVKPDDQSTWETAWQKGVTPWDAGEAQPSLKEAVEKSGLEFPKTGRALVPGCGSGYDLTYIAQATGLSVLGLEIAETALKRANKLIDEAKSVNPKISASISNQDFFTFDPPENERFDLVYDHTFFCAIPPSTRKAWGSQMSKLVKPGGHLIVIVFPMLSYTPDGPPYYIRPEHYEELLSDNFEKLLDKIPEVSSPSHVDKERLVVWRRRA